MAERERPILELRGITKSFPGVLANDHVDFDLRRGEVHALLGENGAGKSTLMNILYGLYHPDEGEIRINGEPVRISSPKAAIELGVGMVHQHFMLIPVMTVAENIVLAEEPRTAGVFLDYDAAIRRVRDLAATFNFAIDPDAKVERITVGQQQRVEILKALFRGADILILDEPTAVLTPQEADELFAILRTLQREGMSIIFISHKLREVLEIAERITVLRRGKKIDTVPREGATPQGLARLMVGREVLLRVEKPPIDPGEPLLRVENLQVLDDRDLEAVRGVSLDVRAREIVALAGVDGNGQSEFIEALSGLRKSSGGTIHIAGRDVTASNAHSRYDSRPRPHPRGSPAARPRPRVHPRREPDAPRLRQAALREVRLAAAGTGRRLGKEAPPGVRCSRRRTADASGRLVGRKPTEGGGRSRGRT